MNWLERLKKLREEALTARLNHDVTAFVKRMEDFYDDDLEDLIDYLEYRRGERK